MNYIDIKKFIKYKLLQQEQRFYNFGFVPDKIDDRDFVYKVRRPGDAPESSNRKNIQAFPWRYDQGQLASCVGHGVSAAFRRVLQVNKMPDFNPSRLFAYWIARSDKMNDTGASIRDAFKAMNKFGLCDESTWPYVPIRFSEQPPERCFEEAEKHQIIRYEKISPVTRDTIKEILWQGYPIVYGKQLYESFMTQKVKETGIVPMPKRKREECFGGHCMVIFDYDEKGTVELNSWGDRWGQAGVCHVPWEYVLDNDLAMDFWVFYLTE